MKLIRTTTSLLLLLIVTSTLTLAEYNLVHDDNLTPLSIGFQPPADKVQLGEPLTIRCHYSAGTSSSGGLVDSSTNPLVSIFLFCPLGPWGEFCFQNCQSACITESPGRCPNEHQLAGVTCKTQTTHDGHVIMEYSISKLTSEWLSGSYACRAVGEKTEPVTLSLLDPRLAEEARKAGNSEDRRKSEIIQPDEPEEKKPKVDVKPVANDGTVLSFEDKTSLIVREILIVGAIVLGFLSLLLNLFCCIRCILIRQYSKSNGRVYMPYLFCMSDEIRTARGGSSNLVKSVASSGYCQGKPLSYTGTVGRGGDNATSYVNATGTMLAPGPHQFETNSTCGRASYFLDGSDVGGPIYQTRATTATPSGQHVNAFVNPDLMTSIQSGQPSMSSINPHQQYNSASNIDSPNVIYQPAFAVSGRHQLIYQHPDGQAYVIPGGPVAMLPNSNQGVAYIKPQTAFRSDDGSSSLTGASDTANSMPPQPVVMVVNQQQPQQLQTSGTGSIASDQMMMVNQVQNYVPHNFTASRRGHSNNSSQRFGAKFDDLANRGQGSVSEAKHSNAIATSSDQTAAAAVNKSNSQDSGKAASLIGDQRTETGERRQKTDLSQSFDARLITDTNSSSNVDDRDSSWSMSPPSGVGRETSASAASPDNVNQNSKVESYLRSLK